MVESNRKSPPYSRGRLRDGCAAFACLLLLGTFVDCTTPEGAAHPGRVSRRPRPIDMDPTFTEKVGREALAKIGYVPIINLARQTGWVTTKEIRHRIAGDRSSIGIYIAQAPTVSEFIDVYTKYAVLAGVTSQLDSPLPGPFDVVAVGELVLGLIDATLLGGTLLESLMEGIEITEYPLPPPTATAAPAATAAPTATPLPTVDTPPVAVTHTRRYPNQTCEDEELDRLQGEKDRVCNAGFAANCSPKKTDVDKIPCSKIRLSLRQRLACLNARNLLQEECFGGKPDPSHKNAIDEVKSGINKCETLERINCAKGHPMAGK